MYLSAFTPLRMTFLCLLNSCSQRLCPNGLCVFMMIGRHQYSRCVVLICLPVGLRRSELLEGRACARLCLHWFLALRTALQSFMSMTARRGMEGGTELRLGKANGWQYCMGKAIKKLKEQAQSMSCNSSELCD